MTMRIPMCGLQFRVFLFVYCISRFHLVCANAQSTTEPATTPYVSPRTNMNPSLSLMIVAFIFAVACMGSLMLSLRYCSGPHAGTENGVSAFKPGTHGVDPAIIDSFPILVYSTIKEHKIGKGALECAVCLSEFQDCETLRLLPKCAHVFHPGCVDAWLAFHVTCPVCRANITEKYTDFSGGGTTLVENSGSTPDTNFNSDPECMNVTLNESVSNYTEVDQHQQAVISMNPDESSSAGSRVIAHTAGNASADALKQDRLPEKPEMLAKFPRSHSTGHSLVQPGQSLERYTLRLPEEIRKQLMENHLKLPRSSSFDSVPFRVGSSRKGCTRCGVEGSSRGSKREHTSNRPVSGWTDRLLLSVGPPVLSKNCDPVKSATRPTTGKDSDDGATTTYGKMLFSSVRMPLDCLSVKSDGAETVSMRPPV